MTNHVPANSTSFTKSEALVGLHTMLCLSSSLSTRRRSFSCASMSSSLVMSEVSRLRCDTIREPMLELQNSYFNITSRSWRFCQMWYLG